MDLGILISVCYNYRNRSYKTYVYTWKRAYKSVYLLVCSLYLHKGYEDQIKPIYYDILLWLKSGYHPQVKYRTFCGLSSSTFL